MSNASMSHSEVKSVLDKLEVSPGEYVKKPTGKSGASGKESELHMPKKGKKDQ